MKTLFFIIFFAFVYNVSTSQDWIWFDLESEYWSGIEQLNIDTLNKNNSWQIGTPNKSIFKAAYSKPKAIVTDTLNPYLTLDTSIFYLTHYRVTDDITYILSLSFDYQVNSDTLTDYGIIEASFDGGLNWINLIEDYQDYGFEWSNGTPSFSGNTNGWMQADINIVTALNHFPEHDSIIYKFSFISDSVQTNKDGWMMDNFGLFDWYESIDENNKAFSMVYPNPTEDFLFVKYYNPTNDLCSIKLFNSKGQLIRTLKSTENLIKLNMHNYETGFYSYLIVDKNNLILSTGKIIKK